MDHLVLSKTLIKSIGLEAASIYSYLLEKKTEMNNDFNQFFTVNLSVLEKELSIKRRKRERALRALTTESLIKIMEKKTGIFKEVRISISRCYKIQPIAQSRCYKIQPIAQSRCYKIQPTGSKNDQRNTASMYSFYIINYINIKKFVGMNPNFLGVRKSVSKLLESGEIENKVSSNKDPQLLLPQKAPEMVIKAKTNTKPRTKTKKALNASLQAQEIIQYLNEKTGKNFRPNATGNLKNINARLKENYSIPDFKKVIDLKVSEWSDKIFSNGVPAKNFLRPSTLFSEKFDAYLNETKEDSLEDGLQKFFEKNNCVPS